MLKILVTKLSQYLCNYIICNKCLEVYSIKLLDFLRRAIPTISTGSIIPETSELELVSLQPHHLRKIPEIHLYLLLYI